MTVQRSAYGAVYLVKKHYVFGAMCRDLTEQERQQLETNRGVHVVYVVDDSPAYMSDILPGDVIAAIEWKPVSGQAEFLDRINLNRGRTVDVSIIRSGKTISKQVTILQ